MSARLPKRIDVIHLADTGQSLNGEIALQECPRLASLVDEGDAKISLSLRFDRQADGIRTIHGQVHCTVSMTCQRCLEPALLPLECELHLGVVASEAQAEQLPAGLDPLIGDAESVSLVDLVEDELILALPIVPMHESCEPPAFRHDEADAETEQRKDNPFAVLGQLKGQAKQ